MSLTRKVLRFGKHIPLIKRIMDRIKENEKKPVSMIFWRTISDISLILYYLTDHPLYFNRIGLVKYDKKFISNLDYLNNLFWLLNIIFDVMCDLVDLYQV